MSEKKTESSGCLVAVIIGVCLFALGAYDYYYAGPKRKAKAATEALLSPAPVEGRRETDSEPDSADFGAAKWYEDNGDGTVNYNLGDSTGTCKGEFLVWTKDANLPGKKLSWAEAVHYIRDMNSGEVENFGYRDWGIPSLPSIDDLKGYEFKFLSMNDTSGSPPAGVFDNVMMDQYWYQISPLDTMFVWHSRYLWPRRFRTVYYPNCP